jgi:membrane protein required for colicin V production
MTSFDAIILVLFFLFLVRGAWVGFIGQLAFLAAIVLGFAAAVALYDRVAALIAPWIEQPQLGFLVTFLLLFLPVYLLITLIGKGLRKVMTITRLTWLDRMLGGLFGLGKGIFVISLLFLTLAGFLPSSRPLLRDSFCYPFLAVTSGYILIFVHDANLRERLLPKGPAISGSLTSSVPAGKPARREVKQKAKEHRLVQ